MYNLQISTYKFIKSKCIASIYAKLNLYFNSYIYTLLHRIFEMVVIYCQYFSNLIPLSFVLGFYVNIVVQRWWSQYQLLPWPDSLSLLISTSIQGQVIFILILQDIVDKNSVFPPKVKQNEQGYTFIKNLSVKKNKLAHIRSLFFKQM